MQKIIIGVVALALVVGGGLLLANGNGTERPLENKVGATIFPVYDIARQIAGEEFEVVLLLPAGASPHTFDPQPSVVRGLEGARAVFAIGHGLDQWSKNLTDSLDIPRVVVDGHIELRESHHEEHGDGHNDHGHNDDTHEDGHHDHTDEHEEHEEGDHGHEHGPIDPHYWLSLENGAHIAENIAEELGRLDSENKALYQARAEAYGAELDSLRDELRDDLSPLGNRNIISLHDAWFYFADAFNLSIVGTFAPSAGKEPTPQYLERLQEEVLEQGVQVIFIEPQLSTDSIRAFANDNALDIAVLDPLGGVEGRQSYIDLMRYNVEQVVSALKE